MVRFASLWNYAQIDHTVAGDAYIIITSRGQYAESSRLESLMLPLSIDSPRALSAVVIFASQQPDSLVFLLMPTQDRGKPQPGTVSSSSVSTVALLL